MELADSIAICAVKYIIYEDHKKKMQIDGKKRLTVPVGFDLTCTNLKTSIYITTKLRLILLVLANLANANQHGRRWV